MCRRSEETHEKLQNEVSEVQSKLEGETDEVTQKNQTLVYQAREKKGSIDPVFSV